MSQQNRESRKAEFDKEYGSHEVKIIPAKEEYTKNIHERNELVGPYCRVSTMSGEQVESFEIQQKHYLEFVDEHPNWTLVGMYADEGISATSTKKRKDFLRLIEDCKNHKVTMILAKSVTRFARNIVDCISTCRMLKSLDPPVGVFFETENIYTLEQNSELQLNMFSLLAQSESETKSLSIKWAIRNRFAKGIPRIVDLYGYTRNKRVLTINNREAYIVRMIYDMFVVSHCSATQIIHRLEEMQVPSPSGKPKWSASTIYYILTNERYAGNVISQKTYVTDLFSHRSVKNTGALPKFEIHSYHEPIIDEAIWLKAQKYFWEYEWKDFLDVSKSIELQPDIKLYPVKLGGSIHEW